MKNENKKTFRFKVIAITCFICLMLNYLTIIALKLTDVFVNVSDFIAVMFASTLLWVGLIAGFWYELKRKNRR